MRGMPVHSALMISPLLFISRAGEFKRHALRSRRRQEAAGRGRLSERLRGRRWIARTTATSTTRGSARPSRDAVPHRHQGEAQRQPKAKYFAKGWRRPGSTTPRSTCSAGRRARSTAGTWSRTSSAAGTPTAKAAPFNFGGYCNPRMTELNKQILVETDTKKRDEMIAEAFTHRPRGGGLHPAAPAVADLGRLEEGGDGAARRQPDPVLLGEDAIGRRADPAAGSAEPVRRRGSRPPRVSTRVMLAFAIRRLFEAAFVMVTVALWPSRCSASSATPSTRWWGRTPRSRIACGCARSWASTIRLPCSSHAS